MGRKKQPLKPGARLRGSGGQARRRKPLPAQGQARAQAHTDQCLRPGSWIYEPEKIVGERQKNMGGGKYETQWEVKWKDWDKKHNTYEPIKNLAGCEDMIVEYRERKRQRESELEHSLDSGARALAVCSIQRTFNAE